MAMTPGGWGVNLGGYRSKIPVNDYGEISGDEPWNPQQLIADLGRKERWDSLRLGRLPNPNMGSRSAKKEINKVMNISKRSKRYRKDYENLQREFALKKMKGIPITESDMRRQWRLEDELKKVQSEADHFYNSGQRINQIDRATNPKRFSGTYMGSSKDLKRGMK